jgi:hypothetical protein
LYGVCARGRAGCLHASLPLGGNQQSRVRCPVGYRWTPELVFGGGDTQGPTAVGGSVRDACRLGSGRRESRRKGDGRTAMVTAHQGSSSRDEDVLLLFGVDLPHHAVSAFGLAATELAHSVPEGSTALPPAGGGEHGLCAAGRGRGESQHPTPPSFQVVHGPTARASGLSVRRPHVQVHAHTPSCNKLPLLGEYKTKVYTRLSQRFPRPEACAWNFSRHRGAQGAATTASAP